MSATSGAMDLETTDPSLVITDPRHSEKAKFRMLKYERALDRQTEQCITPSKKTGVCRRVIVLPSLAEGMDARRMTRDTRSSLGSGTLASLGILTSKALKSLLLVTTVAARCLPTAFTIADWLCTNLLTAGGALCIEAPSFAMVSTSALAARYSALMTPWATSSSVV